MRCFSAKNSYITALCIYGYSYTIFIPVILLIISNHSYEYAISGFFAVGLLLTLIGILIKYTGVKQINDILPLAAIAPIVAIIGLNLIPNTFKQARLITMTDFTVISIALITLVTIIITSTLLKGFLSIIPILLGIIVGYIMSLIFGIIDFTNVLSADWIVLPTYYVLIFDLNSILMILPITIISLFENLGHLEALSHIVNKNLM